MEVERQQLQHKMVVVEIDLDEHAGTLDWRTYSQRSDQFPTQIIKPHPEQSHTAPQRTKGKEDSCESDTDAGESQRQPTKGPKRGIFDDIISKWSGLAPNSFAENDVFLVFNYCALSNELIF